ncbi:MAG: hypothetical protein U0166_26435 [Acidobacteriota bacterium]
MVRTQKKTVGGVAERVVEVTCDQCLERYEVRMRAYGSARGDSGDEEEQRRVAERISRENLALQEAMEACPSCGCYGEAMVARMFEHPMHVGLKRRYDGDPDAVNSPYARAVRLFERGMEVDRIGELLPESALLASILRAFVMDDSWSAVGGRLAGRMASLSEGQRLAGFLIRRRRMTSKQVVDALGEIYGVDATTARSIARTLRTDRARREGSASMAVLGIASLGIAGVFAIVFGLVIPIVRAAKEPPPPEPIHADFPTQTYWASPVGREDAGPRMLPRQQSDETHARTPRR